jgi:prepilin-type N-terminal cleavage/methylation domain-containing protein
MEEFGALIFRVKLNQVARVVHIARHKISLIPLKSSKPAFCVYLVIPYMGRKKGFSLVEIMVASVVFSLVVLGLISVFISASKHITHTRERMTSAQLGKFFLDPLQVYVDYDTWNEPGNELALGIRPGVSQSINNRNFTESHNVGDVGGTDLRRVTTTISWIE